MIAHFTLRLIAGAALMWLLMPRGRVTAGFFRIQMLLVLGLSVLAMLTIGRLPAEVPVAEPWLAPGIGRWIAVGTGLVAYVGSVAWTLDRRRGGNACVFAVAALALGTLLGSTMPQGLASREAGWLVPLGELASAATIGGSVTSMLLGHWYLTAPTMSIEPLKRCNAIFGGGAVCRLLVSAAALASAEVSWSGTYGVWLALRWLAGIAGPLVVAVMVWRILRYRNTQSATGVLFVGVIVVFVGELCGALLYRELLVPV